MSGALILAGAKHSGKTSAGKALAALSGGAFFDLDAEIAAQTGKTARELYRESPAVFQTAEESAFSSIISNINNLDKAGGARHTSPLVVLALGGGFVDNKAAMAVFNAAPCVIALLEVSAETAWRRIEAEAAVSGELPVFLEKAGKPKAAHRILHKRRTRKWRKIIDSRLGKGNLAAFIVNCENKTVDSIVWEIWKKITQSARLPS